MAVNTNFSILSDQLPFAWKKYAKLSSYMMSLLPDANKNHLHPFILALQWSSKSSFWTEISEEEKGCSWAEVNGDEVGQEEE